MARGPSHQCLGCGAVWDSPLLARRHRLAPGECGQSGLVRRLAAGGFFGQAAHPRLIEAGMRALDRSWFSGGARGPVYADAGLDLGWTCMAAPSMHAVAASAVQASLGRAGARVLDVGAGSGYLSALLALLVAATDPEGRGRVVLMEPTEELAARAVGAAEEGLARSGAPEHVSELLVAAAGDGRLGCPEHAPFDAIAVGGACSTLPGPLVEQLAVGGRMVVAVGEAGRCQRLTLVEKLPDGQVATTLIFDGIIMAALK